MNLTTCALCSHHIESGNNIYRGFDNTYCSKACLRKKCFSIDIIDPEHQTPSKWYEGQSQYIIDISNDSKEPENEIQKILRQI